MKKLSWRQGATVKNENLPRPLLFKEGNFSLWKRGTGYLCGAWVGDFWKKLMIRCLIAACVLMALSVHAYGNGTSDGQTTRKIDYLQQSLDDGTGPTELWWYGWVGFYSGATLLMTTLALTTDNPAFQVTSGVGAAESLIGLGGMLIFSYPARSAAEKLRGMPENTPEEREKKLHAAESLLRDSSKAEIAGKSWVQHTLGVLVGAAGSLVIWQVYDSRMKRAGTESWQWALVNFAASTAVSELQIYTEPSEAIADERSYLTRFPAPPPSLDASFLLLPAPDGAGLAAVVRF